MPCDCQIAKRKLPNMRSNKNPSPASLGAMNYPWKPDDTPTLRPVWVLLEQLCRHDPSKYTTVIDGLDMTGRAPGMLVRWSRSGRGDWLGVVHYTIEYIDGRARRTEFRDQLVSAYALEPRHDGKPLR